MQTEVAVGLHGVGYQFVGEHAAQLPRLHTAEFLPLPRNPPGEWNKPIMATVQKVRHHV